MFESLGEKLQGVFKRLSGQGHLTEANIEQALREVRMALLEADVAYSVVKDLLDKVRVKALGQEVLGSLSPGQVLVKVVHDELEALMGGAGSAHLAHASLPPTVILMAGLQGGGKTTTAAKLARHLKLSGQKVMLAACDLQRPAAVDQLLTLGRSLDIAVAIAKPGQQAPAVAADAREAALLAGCDVLIVDTAGRLAVDEALMAELKAIKAAARPHEVLLVVDAMAGRDFANTARSFQAAVGVDGLVLTKMDGDARGGAALSALAVTGKPIKFVGTGEKLEALEAFHPDRMAKRILGMGDVVSLVEKVQASVDQDSAQALAGRIAKEGFTLQAMLEQLRQVKRMGPLQDVLGMLPGMGALKGAMAQGADDKSVGRMEAILLSMSPKERRLPQVIDGSRRKRIAKGSGTSVEEVNRLLRQYEQMKKMMKMMRKGGRRHGMPGMPPGMGGMPTF
jgi:signal recognition particle subunit SRP54